MRTWREAMRDLSAAALAVACCLSASWAGAQALQPGDAVAVYLDGELSLGQSHVIDDAGAAPVAGLGRTPLAGLTPEQAEAQLRATLIARGIYADPEVLVTITARRPIYVSGAVSSPGAFAYSPGVTAAQAVALAGGPRALGQAETVSAVAVFQYYNAVASIDETRRARLRAALSAQRLTAQLEGAATLTLAPPADSALDAALVAEAVAAEQERFALEERRHVEEMALLEESIALITTEIGTVVSRRDELAALVAVLADETSNSESLLRRGLRTQATLVQSQRNLSLARVDLLEMERADTIARQRLAQTRQALAEAPRARRLALEADRRAALDAQAAATARLESLLQQTALFPGLLDARGEPIGPSLRYEIHRGAGETAVAMQIGPDHPLAPGDLLLVTATPIVD